MEEIWKPINSQYFVSNLGRIKSLSFGIEKILKPMKNKKGFLYVDINQKTVLIQRLVAEAFIDNPNNYPNVLHKNNIRDDNTMLNLEWGNKVEIAKRSFHNYSTRVEGFNKYNDEMKKRVVQLSKDGKFVKEWECVGRPQETNPLFHRENIKKVCQHVRNTCGGYVWRYAEEYYATV
jgi:hypothetical protein